MCQRMGREVPFLRPTTCCGLENRCMFSAVDCVFFECRCFKTSVLRIGPVKTLQVQYISGRTRPSGETNGKSGNLNNACRQIYPAGCKIPDNEVICVMDADQARCWKLEAEF